MPGITQKPMVSGGTVMLVMVRPSKGGSVPSAAIARGFPFSITTLVKNMVKKYGKKKGKYKKYGK